MLCPQFEPTEQNAEASRSSHAVWTVGPASAQPSLTEVSAQDITLTFMPAGLTWWLPVSFLNLLFPLNSLKGLNNLPLHALHQSYRFKVGERDIDAQPHLTPVTELCNESSETCGCKQAAQYRYRTDKVNSSVYTEQNTEPDRKWHTLLRLVAFFKYFIAQLHLVALACITGVWVWASWSVGGWWIKEDFQLCPRWRRGVWASQHDTDFKQLISEVDRRQAAAACPHSRN